MADPTLTAARRDFLSLALQQLPPPDPNGRKQWEKAVAEYLRLLALEDAAAEFGAHAQAVARSQRVDMNLEHRFGETFRRHPEAKRQFEISSAALAEAEESHAKEFYHPLWAAEKALLDTPAPDLAAAIFKVELIKFAGLEGWFESDLRAFEIVQADFARLSGEEGQTVDLPKAPVETWDDKLRRYHAACVAWQLYHGSTFNRADEAAVSGGLAIPAEIEAESARLSDVQYAALRDLLDTPAPDRAALLWKLDTVIEIEPAVDQTRIWDGAEVAQTIADYRKFLGAAS